MPLAIHEYGIVIDSDVMVPMRDKVALATDIYYPAVKEKRLEGLFPTILGRTSYGKDWKSLWIDPVANYFVPKGYIVVIQDIRGRGKSGGVGQYFHTANCNEGNDGYDTVEWIASQSWSNGRIGMTGSSHSGIIQTVASLTKPPHLSAIWVDVAPTNIFAHEAREGGCMSLWMFAALFLHAHDAPEIIGDIEKRKDVLHGWQNIRAFLKDTPLKPGQTPLKWVPNLEKTLFEYYYRGEYDEFWQMECCNQEQYFDEAPDIPAVFSGGWYDPFAVATTHQYVAMSNKNKTPQRLDMGPWNHGGRRNGQTYSGDIDFGAEASYGIDGYGKQRLRWFDRWLKDIPNEVENDKPVRIFVMGGGDGKKNEQGKLNHGGFWREEQQWPLSRTNYVKFYFHGGGFLSSDIPNHETTQISYLYDPNRPVPTIASTSAAGEIANLPDEFNLETEDPRDYMQAMFYDGGAHQKEKNGLLGSNEPYPLLCDRSDVLMFETPPLVKDVEITGDIQVMIWISSSAIDTDFTAKLIDVYPKSEDYKDGYHLNLTDSIIRCRYRNGFNRAQMMKPDKLYEINIPLPPISNVFKVNHRIRIDISSSNFPRFDVNPNTGEDVGKHTYMVKATNTVYFGKEHLSYVLLPVILSA